MKSTFYAAFILAAAFLATLAPAQVSASGDDEECRRRGDCHRRRWNRGLRWGRSDWDDGEWSDGGGRFPWGRERRRWRMRDDWGRGVRFHECTRPVCACKDAARCEYHAGDRWHCPYFSCGAEEPAKFGCSRCGSCGAEPNVSAEDGMQPGNTSDDGAMPCNTKIKCSVCTGGTLAKEDAEQAPVDASEKQL